MSLLPLGVGVGVRPSPLMGAVGSIPPSGALGPREKEKEKERVRALQQVNLLYRCAAVPLLCVVRTAAMCRAYRCMLYSG